MSDEQMALYVAVYDDRSSALADLDALEEMHKQDAVGKYDAAVIDQKDGKPHIAKRMDRPRIRIIPEELGFGTLRRKELKEAAAELEGSEAGLIAVGEPTLEKAFEKAVESAAKVTKHVLDATTDEIAAELKEAVRSSHAPQ